MAVYHIAVAGIHVEMCTDTSTWYRQFMFTVALRPVAQDYS